MRLIKYFFLFLLSLFIILIIIILPSFTDIKNYASSALKAKDYTEESINNLRESDFIIANDSLIEANDNFSLAVLSIENIEQRKLIKFIPFFNNQLLELKNLAQSGEIATRSIIRIFPFISSFSEPLISDKFVSLSDTEKEEILKLIYQSEPDLKAFSANLNLALIKMDRIKAKGVLRPIMTEIYTLKETFKQAIQIVDKLPALSQLVPQLAGYPNSSHYLIILHNNDELRPSGGFIGAYGLLDIKNASIKNLSTYDSYHLDMPAYLSNDWQEKAPDVLEKYLGVEKWYLRDSNWYPDWPQSAQNILRIYNGEKKAINEKTENFTGVIGVNPDFVADLIDLVGNIEARGDVYTKDNFQELLQYSVEVSYKEEDISSWDRKDVINEILVELQERLFNLESDKMTEFLSIIQENIELKNIQLFFTDNELNDLAISLGAGGEMKNSTGDYLMVVDANLGAFKSDAVVSKNFEYNFDLEKGVSDLHLNYMHNGGFDWRTTRYQSYTRVYVPFGSKLISLEPYGQVIVDKDSVETFNDDYLNKTVYGFYFKLEPGSVGGINIKYELPLEKLNYFENNNYNLLIQKQSGQRVGYFNFSLTKDNKEYFSNSYSLNKDREIIVE